MTAEEIRKQIDDLKKRHARVYAGDVDAVQAAAYAAPIIQAFATWEIAAQLAELNEQAESAGEILEILRMWAAAKGFPR